MIEHLPIWVNYFFLSVTGLTIVLFHFSNGKPIKITGLIIFWSVLHAMLAYQGFYQNTTALPPRFGLVLIPGFIFIILALRKKPMHWITKNRNQKLITLLHIVRLPVEIVLFLLFTHQMVPELMTFEGRNFDILAGITAPIITLLYISNKLSIKGLLVWNVIALALVSFILFNGVLSAELPIQLFAFDQPNRGIAYFPYILLPATIVPIVIYTHISEIIILKEKLNTSN